MTEFETQQIELLQRQGIGYRRIAAITGLSENTIKSYLRRKVRPKPALAHLCRTCGQPVPQTPHKKEKLYCSDKCRMTWWRTHQADLKKTAFYEFTCLNCGKLFQVYGNATRKYCCRECYLASRQAGGDRHG